MALVAASMRTANVFSPNRFANAHARTTRPVAIPPHRPDRTYRDEAAGALRFERRNETLQAERMSVEAKLRMGGGQFHVSLVSRICSTRETHAKTMRTMPTQTALIPNARFIRCCADILDRAWTTSPCVAVFACSCTTEPGAWAVESGASCASSGGGMSVSRGGGEGISGESP